MLTLEGETVQLLLRFPSAEPFKVGEIYLVDGVEMPGHSGITLEETAQSLLIYIIVSKYMFFVCNLTNYLYYRGQLYECIRKWFLKQENNKVFI